MQTITMDQHSSKFSRGDNLIGFPQTQWSKLLAVRNGGGTARQGALDFLIRRYWKPVYCYIRRLGYGEEDAKDLVQEFFSACLQQNFFTLANPERGRFRNFLLASLKHFLANACRAAHARKRRPQEGLVSLDALVASSSRGLEPAAGAAPEVVFYRAWIADLVLRVLWSLEQECRRTGKLIHYEIFRQRLVLPALEGANVPSLSLLSRRFGLSEKQASNCLLTARRAFQRLLRAEIRTFASSEGEVTIEIAELIRFLSAE